MLVTSRDTKRWVLPKGNLIAGMAAHEAAAHEAYEEAGVTGIACPSPIGSYRYGKRRKGNVRDTLVEVFPLAFVAQLDHWPEMAERDTRWFTIADAAAAVAERDLAALIAGFTEPAPTTGRTVRAVETVRRRLQERIPLLQWFQSLMPQSGRFFELFDSHAATLVAGANALAQLLHGDDTMAFHTQALHDAEGHADDITRQVLHDVRRTFVTPFDRSSISGLIAVMDDTIDRMDATAKAISRFEVTRFDPLMRDMAGIIVEAARLTAEAVPLLRALGPNSNRLHSLTERLVKIEGDADDIYDAGVRKLFKASSNADPMAFIVGREIYDSLERIADSFGDVANEIQGLVIDHA